MSGKWRSLLVSFLTIALVAILSAQSEEWFQSKDHDFGNRWEGLFGQNQGSPDWELRSFVGGVENYSMDANSSLKIRYYVADGSEAFVKAQVINRTRAYLMQPKPRSLTKAKGWRDFTGWATKDVLMPKKIYSRDLGVLIRLGADSEAVNTFAPAMVYYSATPPPLKSYRFDFFTARALKKGSFEVIGANSYRRPYAHAGTGDRGTLSLVFDAPEIPAGWTRVVLRPEYEKSGERLPLEWKFYHERLP